MIYCPKCGAQNADQTTACGSCGAALANPYQASLTPGSQAPINNYLIPAIFSTVCCCLPFGIVSIVYAAQVNGLLAGGNVAGAQRAANSAKMWFWVALGSGLLIQVLYLLFVVIMGLSGNLDANL
jgi:hypothetical protein